LKPLHTTGLFPYGTVRKAVARKEKFVPQLLAVLEETASDPHAFAQDPPSFAAICTLPAKLTQVFFENTDCHSLLGG
jgi:hypothetical protein